MTISTRPATIDDVPYLREIFLVSRRKAFTWMSPSTFQHSDFDTQTEGERIVVAEDEAHGLVGFISVWEPENFIHHLFVDHRYLRRGIGRALLSALPGWPATTYRLKCLALNVDALAFYRSNGFIVEGRGTGEDGDYFVWLSGDVEGA